MARTFAVVSPPGAFRAALLVLLAGVPALVPIALRAQSQALTIKGSLTYMLRIALPPDSSAIVELRDVAAPDGASVLAEQRIALEGRQVPIPFELTVDRSKLQPGKEYVVRGGIVSGGRPSLASQDVAVDTLAPSVDLGAIRLAQIPAPLPFATEMVCGSEHVTIAPAADRGVRVRVGGQTYDLKPVVSASGAKYEVQDDPTTSFWNKGRNGTLMIKGTTYPECTPIAPALRPGPAQQAFSATGNEPAWRLDIVNDQLTLVTDMGATKTTIAAPKAETLNFGRKYTGTADGSTVSVVVLDEPCADSMTGMPRPHAVEVTLEGRILRGCGGDPAALLWGDPWVVREVNGTAPVEKSRVTFVRAAREVQIEAVRTAAQAAA